MQQIKTYEDACKALNLSPAALPDVSMLPVKHQQAIIAHCKLVIIAEALNEGWQPNWSDTDQYKYWPWFDVEEDDKKPSGFGLSFYVCVDWITITAVGSRLCFKSRELAKYAGEQFSDLYEEYFLIQK